MGVYIKGISMPKSCYECKLDLRTGVCTAFCEWKENNPYSIKSNGRLPNCPLVELPSKHGRLVDCDKLVEKEEKKYLEQDKELPSRGIERLVLVLVHGVVMSTINEENAPTVLEAELENDNDV